MTSIGIYVGLLLLIVPGVILWLRWIVVAQAAAIDDEGPLAAMQGSWRLTAGHYRRIFVIAFILFALSAGLTLGARAIPLGNPSGVASVTLGIVVETVIASFAALTLAILYFDLRARLQLPEREPLRPERKLRRPERGRREYQHLRDLD